MDFVVLTYVGQKGIDAYEKASDEERTAEIQEHMEWFAEHRESISGGKELAWPRRWGRIADDQQLEIIDGPYAETKEILGGFILLSTDTFEDACRIASGWPSLGHGYDNRVEVIPMMVHA